MVTEARYSGFPAEDTNVRKQVDVISKQPESQRTTTRLPIAATPDAYSARDTDEFQQLVAFRTTRRGSVLSRTITGSFPCIDDRFIEARERMVRHNHERLGLLYLLEELQNLQEDQQTLVTLWVSKTDGEIKTIRQQVWGRPHECESVKLDLLRENGYLKIIWVDANSLEHELGRHWFEAREGTNIEPPADPSSYIFAGNVQEVIQYNRNMLRELFNVREIMAMPLGDYRSTVVWIELDSGLIDNYQLDIERVTQREGYECVIAKVTRESHHRLIVSFTDTARLQGIPLEVYEWLNHSQHSVIDSHHDIEGALQSARARVKDTDQDEEDTLRPPTRADTPRNIEQVSAVAGARTPDPIVANGSAAMSTTSFMDKPTPLLGPALIGGPKLIGR